jgi:periplasmic divalent cation tolerance protein
MELAHDPVAARLAACAQVTGSVASTYWWEDGLERAEEWLVMLKLSADQFERHSYDESEIVEPAPE